MAGAVGTVSAVDTRWSAVGSSVPRREDVALLTGAAEFVDDLNLPGMVHVRFVRSPVAHGMIRTVDVEEAAQAPGVVGVYSGADLGLPPVTPTVVNPAVAVVPRPVLPIDRVRFAGEAIVAVVADDPYLAEDAADLVTVDIEPLPVVRDAQSALAASAPRLHALESNCLFEKEFRNGDVEGAFATASVTFERTYEFARISPVPMEPRGVLAAPAGAGLLVRSSMQAPNRLAAALTETLDCEPGSIRVLAPDIGGSFGQKGDVFPEDVVVARLAMDLGRPVKWIEDRTENMIAASQARDQRVHVRVAAQRDGTLLAIDADVVNDIGAYGSRAHGPLVEAGGTPSMIPGPYRLNAYRYRAAAVSTNKCPFGAYRGVGTVMAAFVHERVIDTLAQHCGLDRLEVRARNLVPAAAMPFTSVSGRTYDTGDYLGAMRSAERRIAPLAERRRRQFGGEPAVRIGVGFANFVEYSAVTPAEYRSRGMVGTRGDDTARAELDDEGRVHLWTSLPAVGQGSATAFSQLVADVLDVPCERVVVHRTDTALAGMVGTGTGSSRSMVSGGGAVWTAAKQLFDRIRRAAAEITGIPCPQIALCHEGVRVSGTDASDLVRYIDVVKSAAAEPFGVTATFGPDRLVYPSATHACVVSVDGRTGEVRVLDYVVVQDCGRVINPAIVQGQIRGGVAQGIGAALLEGHVYDDQGQLQTSSLMDYLLPTAVDIPDIEVELYGDPTPASLLGAKGMGESGAVPSPAAVAGAVSDAVGVEVLALPIDPGWLAENCPAVPTTGNADVERSAATAKSRRTVPAITMMVAAVACGAVVAILRKRIGRHHERVPKR